MESNLNNLKTIGSFAKKFVLGDGKGTTLYENFLNKFKDRVDENLPLGIKIGSLIEFDILAHIVLAEDEFLFGEISGKLQVFTFGKVVISDDLKIHRFYLKSLDDSDLIYLLEVGTEKENVLSTKIYRMYSELALSSDYEEAVTPDGKAAINHWISGDTPILGAPEFSIFDEGNTDENIVYVRKDSPELKEQRIEKEKEVLYDEPKDENLDYLTHTVAYYGRVTESIAFDSEEFCMVRLSESNDFASIQIYIGVKIEKTQIKIF